MISEKIELILVEKSISKSELARRLKVKRQSIHSQLQYWSNGGIPTLKTIHLWSEALGIKPEELLKELCL